MEMNPVEKAYLETIEALEKRRKNRREEIGRRAKILDAIHKIVLIMHKNCVTMCYHIF